MQFDVRLTGDAATLARTHRDLLNRLPATLHAFILVELQKWPLLFAPEQRYHRTLLTHLGGMRQSDLERDAAGIIRVETDAQTGAIGARDPARFQDQAQALLRKRRLLSAWRAEVDAFFQKIGPAIDAQLHPPDGPRRLVVQVYGRDIAIQPAKLWSRFKGVGVRQPLDLARTPTTGAFLGALVGSREGSAPALFSTDVAVPGLGPHEAWIVESNEALHGLFGPHGAAGAARAGIAGLSYDRLRQYRDDLTRALYAKIQSGVESPQAFAAYARGLDLSPAPGSLLHADAVLNAFVRDVLLTGNGTLFVNNTFVEWAAVQALRRAQPRVLVARYGVRDRLKPFSSLLLFSQPRPSDQIPLIEDPVGSFVDVEQLAYYVWLNAEKSPAYRNRTLYLFLAEGADEMLALRSDRPQLQAAGPAPLRDVFATIVEWLRPGAGAGVGQPLAGVIG